MFTVEVIYALINQQKLIKVDAEDQDTIKDVIEKSDILNLYPEIDLDKNKVGIFNNIKNLEETVKENDRVEIYRILIANPKELRRNMAKKQKEQGIIK